MQFTCRLGVVAGEVEKDGCGAEQGDALADQLGVWWQDHHGALSAERIGQPGDVAVVRRGEEIGLCASLWKWVAWGIHGVGHG
ncbi:hypothetical protein D3C87_1071380 [compost metagenome]